MFRLKKINLFALTLVGVILTSLFITSLSPIAFADNSDDTIQSNGYYPTQAKKKEVLQHQLYWFLVSCFNNVDIDNTPADEVSDWSWFNHAAQSGQRDAVRGSMYDIASASCDDGTRIREAFVTLGFKDDGVAAFCSLNFTFNKTTGGNDRSDNDKGGSTQSCIDGVKAGKDSDGSDGSDRFPTQNAGIRKLLATTTEGKQAAKGLLQDANYLRYYETLLNGCDVALLSQKHNAPGAARGDQYDIPVVDKDGKINWYVGFRAGDGGNKDSKVALVATGTSSRNTLDTYQAISCGDLEKALPALASAYSRYRIANPDAPPAADPGGGSEGPDITCGAAEGSKGWAFAVNPLNWLTCALISAMTSMVNVLDNQIVSMLCINEKDVFGEESATSCNNGASTGVGDTSSGYKKAWDVFRIISLGLLAIAGLVMVLSQTSGFDFVDAYTLRKTMPRLLIAAIAITLSWPLLQFFVGLANDLGIGVRGLIYAPFQSVLDPDTGGIIIGGGGSAITGLLAGAYLTSLGAFGFLTLLATGALAIIVAFAVLTIRNILVVVLLITAPIALAAYVLPNTQNIWKTWWNFFSKALMVFPIITAFIAVGHVFAAISLNDPNRSVIQGLIGYAAYFAPYFLLPATFRFAGGALATIGGFANDRGRGAFDMLRNARKATQADRFKRAQSQSLWDENTFGGLGKYGNKLATWSTDPISNAQYYGGKAGIPGLRKSGAAIGSHLEGQSVEQSRKLMEKMNAMGFNDKAYRAMNGGLHSGLSDETQARLRTAGLHGKSPKSIADLQKIAKIMDESGEQTERTAAQAIHGHSGELATLYKDQEMLRADIGAAGLMGLAAHGFMNRGDLAAGANYLKDEKGEGVARAVGTQAQLMGVRSRPEIKAGYGLDFKEVEKLDAQGNVVTDKNGNVVMEKQFVDGLKDNSGLRALEAISTFNTGDLSGAKAGTFDRTAKGIGQELQYILQNGDTQAAKDASATVKDLRQRKASGDQAAGAELDRLKQENPETLKLAIARDQRESVLDEFAQAIGPYSQASADTKSNMRALLEDIHIDPATIKTRGFDPSTLGQQAANAAAEQQNQGGQGQSF